MSVLCHALDKVRYFRNMLIEGEHTVRVFIGHDVLPYLQTAISDLKHMPVKQVYLMRQGANSPTLVVKGLTTNEQPLLVFLRLRHDSFVKALEEEYSDCEVIVFEHDPTLD